MMPNARGRGAVPLDPHGWVLGSTNPGDDAWRVQHDAIGDVIFSDSTHRSIGGMDGQLAPRAIFHGAVPPEHKGGWPAHCMLP